MELMTFVGENPPPDRLVETLPAEIDIDGSVYVPSGGAHWVGEQLPKHTYQPR